ncbi:MAG: porin family protein [Myxococcales bacterium]|nr:porin family protein [Myxococcales bacterium]
MSLRRAKFVLAALPLLAFPLLLASAGEAHAGGYVGAGIGSGSELSGDIASHFETDEDTTSFRVLVGERFGALAVEGSLFGSQLRGISGLSGDGDFTTLSLGIDLKYYVGLVAGLEGYGKIGLNKTWLTGPDTAEDWNYEGRGQELGVGLQYNINLPLAKVGFWIDYTAQHTELRDGDNQALDGTIEMANIGVSVGF